MELGDSEVKNLILKSIFLSFKSYKGVILTFRKMERVLIMINVTCIRLTLVGMYALKDTNSSSNVITSPILLSRFLLGSKVFLIFKNTFQNSKCHWMD